MYVCMVNIQGASIFVYILLCVSLKPCVSFLQLPCKYIHNKVMERADFFKHLKFLSHTLAWCCYLVLEVRLYFGICCVFHMQQNTCCRIVTLWAQNLCILLGKHYKRSSMGRKFRLLDAVINYQSDGCCQKQRWREDSWKKRKKDLCFL